MNRNGKIYVGIVTLAVVCTAILSAATMNTKREAQALLSELQAISIGSASFDEVQRIASRFRSRTTEGVQPCSPDECDLRISFENSWLRRLHLATPTTFGVVLLVRNGRLYYVNAAMTLYSGDQVISASTTLSDEGRGQSAYRIVAKRGVGNQPWQAIVHLTPNATLDERRAGFSFNLSCLDKLGGCKDSSDLLPSAWR
jgi:hypothetical protein